MNSDLDAIAAAVRWQSTAQDQLAAIAAYHDFKEQEPMTQSAPIVSSEQTQLIYAGCHACSLALMILAKDPDGAGDALARTVLTDWGLEWKEIPADEKPDAEPKLVWPPVNLSGRPLAAQLNPAYFKVHYRVHETLNPPALSGRRIGPHDKLMLISAHWDEEIYTWRMQFTPTGVDGIGNIWTDHCKVHPGDPTHASVGVPPGEGA